MILRAARHFHAASAMPELLARLEAPLLDNRGPAPGRRRKLGSPAASLVPPVSSTTPLSPPAIDG
jgi:hypothetical protein